MSTLHAEYSNIIDARADVIYNILTDYKVGHAAILPKQYFTVLNIEQGGDGAGTIVNGVLKFWGKEYHFHQIVSEPEPGRMLVETDLDTPQVTEFVLEALDGGQRTRVTIASNFPASAGIAGFMERMLKPAVMQRIYKAELEQLSAYLSEQSS